MRGRSARVIGPLAEIRPPRLDRRSSPRSGGVSQLDCAHGFQTKTERQVTAKADFTPQEWELVLEGPPSAGMIVITAQRGGTVRETISMAKAYVEARQHHGQSELLDEIVSAKPEIDHTRYHSVEEIKEHSLQHLRDAVALLEAKATPAEVDDYKRFVLNLAEKVANAHREGFLGRAGEPMSDAERAAIGEIAGAIGTSAP
jgi:hypothetical protein